MRTAFECVSVYVFYSFFFFSFFHSFVVSSFSFLLLFLWPLFLSFGYKRWLVGVGVRAYVQCTQIVRTCERSDYLHRNRERTKRRRNQRARRTKSKRERKVEAKWPKRNRKTNWRNKNVKENKKLASNYDCQCDYVLGDFVLG